MLPPRLLSFLPLLLSALPAQEPRPAEPSAALAAAVTARLELFRQQQHVPGLSCAIGVDDRIAFAGGSGLSDLENQVPATADTVYRLASISKPVTAACVLRLCEQGRLDLDADVRTYVPEFPAKPWPLTLRQLLCHTAGVRHYRPGEAESTRHYRTQRQGLERFAADPLLHEPGTAYRYSTYGYCLLAAAVEAAMQKPFAACVRELVALPCAAPTLQDDDPQRLIPHRAQGYVRTADGGYRNSVLMDGSYKLGGGGLCSSAPDLLRFAQALLHDRLLQRTTRQAMWAPASLRDGKPLDYGLGFRVGRHDGSTAVWHSGAQSRVSTMLYLLPGQRLAVALLADLEGLKLLPLARELAALALPAQAR